MADIDLKPTAEMAANATRGLELREKHGKGGTAVGVARARDIKNRANLSPDTVKRMHSFFSRHEGNQAGGEDDAGYIAWMLWGGDAGKSWAKRKVEQIDGKSESMKSDNNRPGAKAKFANLPDSYIRTSDYIKQLLNEIARAFKQKNHEDLKEASHDLLNFAKQLREEAWRDAADMKKNPKDWSRPGEKAKFDEYWEPRNKDQATKIVAEIAKLIPKYESRRKEIRDAIFDLQTANNLARDAISRESTAALDKAMEYKQNADRVRSSFSRPGAKAKFQKLSEHMNHIVALCDKVLAVLYRESPDKSLGGVWAKTAQDVHEIKATAHQISRQSWAYSRPDSAAKFSSNPYIAAAVKKAQHLRLAAKDLIAALSSGNKDEARRIVSGMRYGIENIDTHIKAFMSRPGAKAKAANNQVYWEPFHEEMYEYTHGKKPRGSGWWIFIAPDKSLVRVPGMMTYSEAKRWLKQNAPMSGHYKVATQRPGSAAKFGQVGEMLSQIESQSHDQRDLAKSNLRKLAAKIADIDHTREEWERYVRVAKSLGYSESQIAGFSRPGAKAKFEKSDEYAAVLMKPVTVANCGRMMKVAEEAMKYAKSVGDDDLFELAEEVGHECQATKSRASRKEAR